MSKRKKAFIICACVAAAITAALLPAALKLCELPGEIFLTDGSSRTLNFGLPFTVSLKSDAARDVVSIGGTSLKDIESIDLSEPVVISSEESGSASISFDLFGMIPIKNINVTVGEEVLLYPGGQSIGVMLYTDGALVVGSAYITTPSGDKVNPAEASGLSAGDIIASVNGSRITDAAHLSEIVNASSGKLLLGIKRGSQSLSIEIEPARDASDGKYKLGVWVRDSTAGVGTLTFLEPVTGTFAGLGHAITDTDTGELLTVRNGEIIESRIIEVVKGTEGEPGELKGVFDPLNEVIGHINKNTGFGIYGSSDGEPTESLYQSPIPAASRDEVQLGAASICCSVDNRGVRAYDCSIIKMQRQNQPAQKSFIIEVTDPELLALTGGIVQGMSGSPLIQNGKLIGAVTHVFVNDPSRGYGIYIDWMLNEIE